MRVKAIAPSNGGVVVLLHPDSVEGPLGFGYVVEAGAGVPWLECGYLVAFQMDKAQSVRIPVSRILEKTLEFHLTSDTNGDVMVYLTDQRNVIARLSHLPIPA